MRSAANRRTTRRPSARAKPGATRKGRVARWSRSVSPPPKSLNGCGLDVVRRRRSSDSDLRPVPIVEALDRHEVRYVAIGSYAAIAQGVDLDITDFDIVPATDEENRARLVGALRDLGARETVGLSTESIYELSDDPSSIADVIFREFSTEFGKLDIVFRPAGFPRGYDDLVEHVVIVEIRDENEPDRTVEVAMADKAAVYDSKRA